MAVIVPNIQENALNSLRQQIIQCQLRNLPVAFNLMVNTQPKNVFKKKSSLLQFHEVQMEVTKKNLKINCSD